MRVMTSTYRLNADDLNPAFLAGLKTLFQGKEVEIEVTEVDETAYLLRSPANRDHLHNVVRDVESGANLVKPDQALFQ
jgi:antitoxin YefM